MGGRVVHFEIPFDDGDRARAFYREAFGWDVAEMPDMDYTMVSTGPTAEAGPRESGFINGGMAQRGDSFVAPTVVIDVEDIDAALEKIEGLGGATLLARTPVGDMGFSAYFRDPEGNAVGLWQNA
jgi:predicted enzyme related to lactoylglutathione lyase